MFSRLRLRVQPRRQSIGRSAARLWSGEHTERGHNHNGSLWERDAGAADCALVRRVVIVPTGVSTVAFIMAATLTSSDMSQRTPSTWWPAAVRSLVAVLSAVSLSRRGRPRPGLGEGACGGKTHGLSSHPSRVLPAR